MIEERPITSKQAKEALDVLNRFLLHFYHETIPSLWVINAVDVATNNKIHCNLQQILDIKLFHYQGFSVVLSELFTRMRVATCESLRVLSPVRLI